jgi:hypothetical protein
VFPPLAVVDLSRMTLSEYLAPDAGGSCEDGVGEHESLPSSAAAAGDVSESGDDEDPALNPTAAAAAADSDEPTAVHMVSRTKATVAAMFSAMYPLGTSDLSRLTAAANAVGVPSLTAPATAAGASSSGAGAGVSLEPSKVTVSAPTTLADFTYGDVTLGMMDLLYELTGVDLSVVGNSGPVPTFGKNPQLDSQLSTAESLVAVMHLSGVRYHCSYGGARVKQEVRFLFSVRVRCVCFGLCLPALLFFFACRFWFSLTNICLCMLHASALDVRCVRQVAAAGMAGSPLVDAPRRRIAARPNALAQHFGCDMSASLDVFLRNSLPLRVGAEASTAIVIRLALSTLDHIGHAPLSDRDMSRCQRPCPEVACYFVDQVGL